MFPVFAQEEDSVGMNDDINSTFDLDHSEIQDGINELLGDESHSEIQDGVNELGENQTSMMTLFKQFNGISTINSYTGLVLGAIAILITIGFGAISRRQNTTTNNLIIKTGGLITETQSLTREIKKDTEELTKIRNEVKEDVSFTLKKRIHFVKRNLKRCVVLYDKYQKEKDLTKKENYLNSAFGEFDRCYLSFRMDLDLIKLMEIFGRAIGRQYWSLLTDFQMNSKNFWLEDINDELDAFMSHVKNCLKNTESFEKIIEPFASAYVKGEKKSSSDSTPPDSVP